MKKFNGYEQAQAFDGEYEKLPLGGHILTIKGTKIDHYDWGEVLVLAVDIAEGESKGYYQRLYDNKKATNPEYKWPGTFRQTIPAGDGSDKDKKSMGWFKGMITAIEKSNPGYSWNWDENSLAGKKVGGIFGEEEYIGTDGSVRKAVKCFSLRSVDAIRKGVEVPEIKKLKQSPAQQPSFNPTDSDDTSLPFDL